MKAHVMASIAPPPGAQGDPVSVPVAPPAVLPTALSDNGPRRISSERLFDGAAEVQIDHHGAIYRLKQTALGKLILTK